MDPKFCGGRKPAPPLNPKQLQQLRKKIPGNDARSCEPVSDPLPVATGSADDHAAATALLKAYWRSPDAIHQLGALNPKTRTFQHAATSTISEAVSLAMEMSSAGMEVYFALAEYRTDESRKAENTTGAYGFWLDIDCGKDKAANGTGYETIDQAQSSLQQFLADAGLPAPTFIISSGGGLHVHWVLSERLDRETWQSYAAKLKDLTRHFGLLADPSRTADIASVLRLPGTKNWKTSPPKTVRTLVQAPDYIDRNAMLECIDRPHGSLPAMTQVTPRAPGMPKMTPRRPKASITELKATLEQLDPDCDYEDWTRAGMAIFFETDGSDAGFELFDSWSRKGMKYPGQRELEKKWRSFRLETPNPVTMGTLVRMAKAGAESEEFEWCDFTVVEPSGRVTSRAPNSHPLGKYSLQGQLPALEAAMVEQVPILGDLILSGQASVIYASPNTGKTLVTLHLLTVAISAGRVDPSNVYYINMDDNGKGLLEKGRLADEYGFHMLAQGYRGFEPDHLTAAMEEMVRNDSARGVVIILDTLKKFVDTMRKDKSSTFARLVRQVVMKGGTVIALAHTNKHPGPDGRPVFAGTSDIVDDFDCAHTLATVPQDPSANEKVIEFANFKRRGNVALSAAYAYALERSLSYEELLASVRPVALDQLEVAKHEAEMRSDAEVIAVTKNCIAEGIVTKMKLAKAVSNRTWLSQRQALQIIEKYTGADPLEHHWSYSRQARGAHIFELIAPAAGDSEPV